MKIILQIAKTELKTLFFSPIAWFVLAIFAVQAGLTFSSVFEHMLSRQLMNYINFDLSRALFVSSNPQGTLLVVQNYLFLYLPLLTMTVMYHEHQTGSIRLLYSSPIAGWQIIIGKYLALLAVGLMFVLVVSLQGVYAFFTFDHFDGIYFIVAMIGLLLLIAAYSAIGLFLACVIRYPIAAAIATMALLLLLGYVGEWFQDIPVLSQIVYWLSIKNRLNPIVNGLLCSEDFFYFTIVSALFVLLCILWFYFTRRQVNKWYRALCYGGIVIAAVVAGWLTCQPRLMSYFDSTKMKSNSLLPQHQEIIQQLDGPLKITTYVNLLGNQGNLITPNSILSDKKFSLSNYIRFKPEIETEYVFYYNDPSLPDANKLREKARLTAIMYDQDFRKYLSPEEINKRIDLSGEDYQMVRVIERGNGQQQILRIFNDPQAIPSESEWMAAFKRLAMPLPNVSFLSGHGERSMKEQQNRDLSFMAHQNNYRHALTNQGFDISEKNLLSDNLDDTQILVVAGCQEGMNDHEIQQIMQYLKRGGNLLVMTDEGCEVAMKPLMDMLGIAIAEGVVEQQHENERPQLVLSDISAAATPLDSAFYWMAYSHDKIAMNGVKAIAQVDKDKYMMTPMLVSGDLTTMNGAALNDSLLFASALSRKVGDKEQRVVVVGDCDWISNGELLGQRPDIRTANAQFVEEVFRWLAYGEVPLQSGRKIGQDNTLTVNDQIWIPITRILFCIVIPLILLLSGAFILLRRRNK